MISALFRKVFAERKEAEKRKALGYLDTVARIECNAEEGFVRIPEKGDCRPVTEVISVDTLRKFRSEGFQIIMYNKEGKHLNRMDISLYGVTYVTVNWDMAPVGE